MGGGEGGAPRQRDGRGDRRPKRKESGVCRRGRVAGMAFGRGTMTATASGDQGDARSDRRRGSRAAGREAATSRTGAAASATRACRREQGTGLAERDSAGGGRLPAGTAAKAAARTRRGLERIGRRSRGGRRRARRAATGATARRTARCPRTRRRRTRRTARRTTCERSGRGGDHGRQPLAARTRGRERGGVGAAGSRRTGAEDASAAD